MSEGVREQQRNRGSTLMRMKATAEEPVFSGLVDDCPSFPQTQDCLDEGGLSL